MNPHDIYNDYDCFIFDLDGTLIESVGAWKNVDDKFMAKRGRPVPDGFYEKVSTLNLWQAAEFVISEYQIAGTPEEIVNEWTEMIAYAYANNIGLVKGAKEFFQKLREHGKKLCLATACNKALYEPCLIHNGVLEYFDCFATTAEVERKKGFPDVYLLAAERAGVAPERCCVFEDIYQAMLGAKAGGMACIARLEPHSHDSIDKISAVADMVLNDYTELL